MLRARPFACALVLAAASCAAVSRDSSGALRRVADEVERQCRDGRADACVVFGGFARAGVGRAADPRLADDVLAFALALARRQCEREARGDACDLTATLLLLQAPRASVPLFERGCALGDGRTEALAFNLAVRR